MAAQTMPRTETIAFTHQEWRALRRLRREYQQDRDLFSEPERARLRFMRWLYQAGRLEP